jgi:7-cyano-7-deazaguanine synthase
MDSCVTAAIARENSGDLAFLHISYGQRTEERERKAFNDIADFYDVAKRLDVSIEHLAKIGGSSLTDAAMNVTEADLESKEIPTSYVHFRNANMLAIAVSWAEVLGANHSTSAPSRKIRAATRIAVRNSSKRFQKDDRRGNKT